MLNVKLNENMTVDELLVIGTALKSAQVIINEETDRDSKSEGIDNAISIIDEIVNNGTN